MRKRKIKRKAFGKLFISLGLLILLVAGYFVVDYIMKDVNGESKYLLLNLVGDKEINIKYKEEYKDQGATSSYKDENLTDKIKVETDIDFEHVGSYKYKYEIKYKNQKKTIERTVNIIDEEKPQIALNGGNEIILVEGGNYKELGATVKDNYDTNLEDKIVIDASNLDTEKAGIYKIKYTVKDSSNNEDEIERTVKVAKKLSNNGRVPVLNYHFFYKEWSEDCHEDLCLQIDKFRQQLQYLKDNDYYTLTIEEFTKWMYGEIDIPEKSILITVDDGAHGTSKINGNHLIPILEEYKMHATLFLITGWWDIENYRSEYLDVQSHTNNLHTGGMCSYRSNVNCISHDELVKDLKKSIDVVKDTNSFCFPFYEYTDASIQAVKDAGFRIAFVGGGRKASRSDNKYKIPRYPIHDSTTLEQFKKFVS